MSYDTPILYLMFNRPDLVKQTFPKIREIKPKYLFLAADGPREGNLEDIPKCTECKEWVLKQIDWDCKVQTLFRDSNLGCGIAVSSAITWFFEHVEMGIILEDDIIADITFFLFCENMLHVFKDDHKIHHITGINPISINKTKYSIYYSKYSNVWGWATWKRAWLNFNFLNTEPNKEIFLHYKFSKDEIVYWNLISNQLKTKQVDSWAYRWQFSIWKSQGYSVFPRFNMIRNIGFGEGATHTKQSINELSNLNVEQFKFKSILKPKLLIKNVEKKLFNKVYYQKTTLKNKIRNILYKVLPSSFVNDYRKLKKHLH